jgi:hypothetical protein
MGMDMQGQPTSEAEIRHLHMRFRNMESDWQRLCEVRETAAYEDAVAEMFDAREQVLRGADDTQAIDMVHLAARIDAALSVLDIAAGPPAGLPSIASVRADLSRIVAGDDLCHPSDAQAAAA